MEDSLNNLINFTYDETRFDSSNPLVLPSKRCKSSSSSGPDQKRGKQSDNKDERILSKKKRKELQRKISQKEKKLTRAELWKELQTFQSDTKSTSLSMLPLFTRTRKQKQDKPSVITTKCKSWKVLQSPTSEASKSTDEYSTDEELEEECEHRLSEDDTNEHCLSMAESLSASPLHHASVVSRCDTDTVLYTRVESKPARFVLVSRTPEVTTARLTLPIIAEECSIMEAINENDCVIICGSTGCGKTTQVPQFLYEAGFSRNGHVIGVTEPRRVAAISMSQRVGEELNLPQTKVSYHIRYEKTAAKETEIKFMTDGVLLQEMKQDFELSRYSAIIVDEAHERSIYTDVLLGLISIVLRLRRRRFLEHQSSGQQAICPLKLIIMSATLRVSDFAENRRLFPPSYGPTPPVIHVESRQYPVTCHFAKITHEDYLKAAFRKVVQLHKSCPAGGILVFLTGQREVLTLCNWLSRAFSAIENKIAGNKQAYDDKCDATKRNRWEQVDCGSTDTNVIIGSHKEDDTPRSETSFSEVSVVSRINLDNFDIIPNDEEIEFGSVRTQFQGKNKNSGTSVINESNGLLLEDNDFYLTDFHGEAEDIDEFIHLQSLGQSITPVYALPLYSLLTPERQQLVFQQPPEGSRLVVAATNVAETSLTIPNIRYVVDSGKVKTKVYDPVTGASTFEIVWVSQASAEQRAGRAGRVAPGHCYRLYSSQVFTSMQPFSTPDILVRPIDDVVLMLKSYLGSTPLSRFPLPTWPSDSAVLAAERRLISLGALQYWHDAQSETKQCRITRAGRWMARLPLPSRFARMLLFANQHQLMPYAVCLVAGLSVPDLFLSQPVGDSSDQVKADETGRFRANFVQQFVRRSADLYLGDLAITLGTICCLERYAAQFAGVITPEPDIVEFCGGQKRISRDPETALRLLVEHCGVRWNAFKEVRHLRRQLTEILNANVPELNLSVDFVLPRPTVTQVSHLRQLFLVGSPFCVATKFSGSLHGLSRKERRRLRHAYQVPGFVGPVFIDSASPLATEKCQFVAFLELHTASKPCLRTVCSIDPQWLPFLAPNNYKVDGLVLTDEQVTETSHIQYSSGEEEDKEHVDSDGDNDNSLAISNPAPRSKSSLITLPSPRYDATYDNVLTGAKSIHYFTTGLVGEKDRLCDVESDQFQLPFTVLVPVNSLAAARSLGANEALMWSVRWFTRALLEGKVFPELKTWFPHRIRPGVSPSLLTVSWGIVKPEVRKLIGPLVDNNIDSQHTLRRKWQLDPQFVITELSAWLLPEYLNEFHTSWPLVG